MMMERTKVKLRLRQTKLPSDTVINYHVASVIMVDEGEHDNVSTMDNVGCVNKDISIGGSSSPSSSSQNEEIVTNYVCKEFTSMLLNTGSDFGTSCYELMNMMELGQFEKGSIFSDSKARKRYGCVQTALES
jgi:hypothetical protein